MEEAKKIARNLVESKIAACVNIIPNLFSIYEWKNKIEEDNELLLLIKTNEKNSDKLVERIKEIHSYSNPECVGVKIEKGSEKYLKWISDIVN